MNCLLISPSSSPQQSWKVRIWWMWTFPGRRALNICRILLFKLDLPKNGSHAFFLPQNYQSMLWLSSIQLIIVLKKRLGIVYLIKITRSKQSLFAFCTRQPPTIPSISQLDVEVEMLLKSLLAVELQSDSSTEEFIARTRDEEIFLKVTSTWTHALLNYVNSWTKKSCWNQVHVPYAWS